MKRELEEILDGVRQKYLPYRAAYKGAQVSYQETGQGITWPQKALHCVSNFDRAVLLLTKYRKSSDAVLEVRA